MIKSLSEIYKKLNNKMPEAIFEYDSDSDTLIYEKYGMKIEFSDLKPRVRMVMYREDKEYEYIFKNANETYYIIKRLYKDKFDIENLDVRNIKFIGLLWYRKNYKPVWAKVLMTVFGSIIIAFAAVMMMAGVVTLFRWPGSFDLKDWGLLLFIPWILYAGISVIRNAFGFPVYEFFHFLGALMIGFSICMLFFEVAKYEDRNDLIGGIVLFGFVLLAGVFLFVISFIKSKDDYMIIKRTPKLPIKEELQKIYDKVYEVKRSIAYTFDYTDDIPKYNGSRVGGSPYAEGGMEASVTYNNEKMKFLFQLNLSEVNLPDGFPDRGLLQFFIMDKERYEGCIKVLYHPHIDTMSSGDVNGAVAIRLIQNTIPSSLSVKLEDIYNAAYELGIYLSPDLELSDFYDNGLLVETNEDYLLGATRLLPPINPYASEYSAARIPLLYVSPESPLINKWCENISDTYIEGFQIFISREGITERDFDKIVVCA